ncbi:MAG: hypothetical protein ACOYM2_11035 [Rectinemataceae bacterium]
MRSPLWSALQPIYDDHYRIYRQLYDRNAGLMHDLARLRPH